MHTPSSPSGPNAAAPSAPNATEHGGRPTVGESWSAFSQRVTGPQPSERVGRAALGAIAALHAAGELVEGDPWDALRWLPDGTGFAWQVAGRPAPGGGDVDRTADLLRWGVACHRAAGHAVERALRSKRGGTTPAALRVRLARSLDAQPSGWSSAFARAVASAIDGTASNAAPLYGVLMLEGEEAPAWQWDTWSEWQGLEAESLGSPAPRPSRIPQLRRAAIGLSFVAATVGFVWATAQWVNKWRPPVCDADADCGADSCVDGVCTPQGFVYLPPTALRVGAPNTEPGSQGRAERPFPATISRGYYLQAAEVTQGDWERTMGSRPSYFASCGQRCPVDSVNWFEAVAYANAKSRAEGLTECYVTTRCRGELGDGCEETERRLEHGCGGDYHCERVHFVGLECNGYRLPTEVEWENGARAGTMTATWWGPLEVNAEGDVLGAGFEGRALVAGTTHVRRDDLTEQWPCALAPDATCGPSDVATLPPNPWGLYDMIGGVSEWTHDAWAEYPEEATVDRVADDEEATRRLVRGGAWYHTPDTARAAQRRRPSSRTRWYDVGFRLARTAILSSDL